MPGLISTEVAEACARPDIGDGDSRRVDAHLALARNFGPSHTPYRCDLKFSTPNEARERPPKELDSDSWRSSVPQDQVKVTGQIQSVAHALAAWEGEKPSASP